MPVSPARPKLSPGISQTTRQTTYELFTPSNSGQRSHPTYYRGCWHVVSRCFFSRYRHHKASSLAKGVYNPRPSSPTRRRCIRLAPIVQYSPLLPPVGVWAVSQSQCGRTPSQAGYPSTLGRPLPHQQADRPQAHPTPHKAFHTTPTVV